MSNVQQITDKRSPLLAGAKTSITVPGSSSFKCHESGSEESQSVPSSCAWVCHHSRRAGRRLRSGQRRWRVARGDATGRGRSGAGRGGGGGRGGRRVGEWVWGRGGGGLRAEIGGRVWGTW